MCWLVNQRAGRAKQILKRSEVGCLKKKLFTLAVDNFVNISVDLIHVCPYLYGIEIRDMKKMMILPRKELIVMDFLNNNEDEILKHGNGTYRVITKCQAGFMCSSDVEAHSPIGAFRRFKAKAIQSIAYITKYGPITVFARSGKKVWASREFLSEVTVGDINQSLTNTGLYSQSQYAAVNAKFWSCNAYVMNEEKSLEKVA
jgi:hypothetical protein